MMDEKERPLIDLQDVSQQCLSNQVVTLVECSYARSNLLENRRILMENWALFNTTTCCQVIGLSK
jgi:hypothetical protein